jgi:hypothetical protein
MSPTFSFLADYIPAARDEQPHEMRSTQVIDPQEFGRRDIGKGKARGFSLAKHASNSMQSMRAETAVPR